MDGVEQAEVHIINKLKKMPKAIKNMKDIDGQKTQEKTNYSI